MGFRTTIWPAALLVAACLYVGFAAPSFASGPGQAKVYVIDVHGTVWPGQASFVIDKLNEAAQQGASAVILDVDTFGGFATSATDIKDAIISHDKDYVTVGYVHDRALSSGSLITLSCKYIAMAPAATLGSAQPHPGPGGGDPDPELLSWARKEFAATAEYRGRNPAIAIAWVTAPSAMPALGVKAGDILTLTTRQAQANGYCDVVATGIPDILAFLKLSGAAVVPEHLDFWESASEWICDPWITALILGIGLALVIAEMLTMHSWGVAGIIGGVAVLLVFAAHIVTGTASWVGVILFVAGIGLLLFEAHVLPGHGLSALAGLICIFLGIFWAIGGGRSDSALPFVTSIVITIGALVSFFMYLPKSRIWRVLGQNMQQRAALGYVSSRDYTDLLGRQGMTMSVLRPSGIAEIDGIRFNVVTEGSFLQPGSTIEVVLVQGNRIVVRELAAA